ncbi:MAG TPA: 30S ribosomal protein S20 [Clostridiales bacterium]|nr:30S ribosomal protein S20 [Clostridiales bacterium]
MPNIKSAKKRVKVIATKTMRNKVVKSALKTELKKFDAAVAGDADNKQALFAQAVGAVDKAAVKGIIHRNKANRTKAQLAKKLNAKAAE